MQRDIPVVVDGLRVEPGDLIHGDVNGVISVPTKIAHKLPVEVEKIRAQERDALSFIRSPEFDLDSALKRMGHCASSIDTEVVTLANALRQGTTCRAMTTFPAARLYPGRADGASTLLEV